MIDNNIKFVVRHYRRNAFAPRRAWTRMGLRKQSGTRSILKIAAAAAVLVAVTATAAVLIRNAYFSNSSPEEIRNIQPTLQESPLATVHAIDFDNAPLPIVIDRINEVYGIEITNLPADAGSHRLTLHYEGNAAELVETINEILDINLLIKEE